jgi:hypothetical protein
MNWKPDIRMAFSLGLALGLTSICGFGEAERGKAGRPKVVFTNDDLQKYQDGIQASAAVDTGAPEKEKVNHEGKTGSNLESLNEKTKPRSYFSDRLKETQRNLNQAKMEEQRFGDSLIEYQKKFGEAETEFQKKTAQWQVEDTEKNLARSTAARKKAEEGRTNVLLEAAKQGFKVEDLQEEKAPNKMSQ